MKHRVGHYLLPLMMCLTGWNIVADPGQSLLPVKNDAGLYLQQMKQNVPSGISKEALQAQYEAICRSPWANRVFIGYQTDPFESAIRSPEALPAPAGLDDEILLIGTRGEELFVSLVLLPLHDFSAVEVSFQGLTGEKGMKAHRKISTFIPPNALDVRIVKKWYRSEIPWIHSPVSWNLYGELLLHDEDLVQIDPIQKHNFLRVTDSNGKSSRLWLNSPLDLYYQGEQEVWKRYTWSDSPEIKPFRLQNGVCKQLFLSLRIPKNAAAGLYHGEWILKNRNGQDFVSSSSLTADAANGAEPSSQYDALGLFRVTLRVLPFALPDARPLLNKNNTIQFHTELKADWNAAKCFLSQKMQEEMAYRDRNAEARNSFYKRQLLEESNPLMRGSGQQTENPAWLRRIGGLTSYLNLYDVVRFETPRASSNPWLVGRNQDVHFYLDYPDSTGTATIPTLQGMALRAGLLDVRYATALKQLAQPLLNSPNSAVAHAARRSMELLLSADPETVDPAMMRLELIAQILELRAIKEKEGVK